MSTVDRADLRKEISKLFSFQDFVLSPETIAEYLANEIQLKNLSVSEAASLIRDGILEAGGIDTSQNNSKDSKPQSGKYQI